MLHPIRKILFNRNMILVMAVVAGLIWGNQAAFFKDWTMFILAFVMMFSMTGILSRSLVPVGTIFRPMLYGVFLNYVIFSTLLIPMAWFLMPDRQLFYGFVVIAATPPGVAVIPFSHILGGNMRYSILGTFGAFLGSILISPFMIYVFAGRDGVDPFQLFWLMIKLVVMPFILSRFLLFSRVFKVVERIRGAVVNWGFAIIIFTVIGMNRQVFNGDFIILLLISIVLFVSIFGMGILFEIYAGRVKLDKDLSISQTLLVTIKSSGFAAVTAYSLFGQRAAIPSALLAIFVLLYLIYLSLRKELKKDINQQ